MSPIYGKHFAEAYKKHWAHFGPHVWPFLTEQVRRRCPNASTWLDLCCGTGSLLKLVTKAGYEAVGVDASPHQLRHARRNAPGARLVHSDVRELDLARRFDVVTCMFDSLNCLTKKRDLERAFRRARRHLTPGGVFVFDVNTYAGLQDNWCRTSTLRDDGRLLVMETSFDERRAIGHCLITGFVEDGGRWRRFDGDHVQRGYRPEEVDGLLERVGLTFRKLGGRTFGRPRKRSKRLFYVCGRESR